MNSYEATIEQHLSSDTERYIELYGTSGTALSNAQLFLEKIAAEHTKIEASRAVYASRYREIVEMAEALRQLLEPTQDELSAADEGDDFFLKSLNQAAMNLEYSLTEFEIVIAPKFDVEPSGDLKTIVDATVAALTERLSNRTERGGR